ncbi:methionyl-tRNA formyltransferase [Chitinimonas sp. BJB300]|uniref:methionyl-tRNA formyltransferase n=1 Tax=Chitinimonas sp. BJB300 TaxID=1559339 RepID=UPI000C105C91|nr:methionyl-tRNA formyltransferase [Chitinimonas sp. BJB300]PHV11130.1 methionyl-tRNA formyltransferase [Chitinimonas sp. BJB300]TSJ90982.1 methionyl-tRNA formyltransferase [Chitinimonas sp. BJB300]
MKIIFAGTPEFAASALQALLDAGHEVVMVLTQPDRPAGRGMKLLASPVKQLAERHNITVYQPEKLRTAEQQAPLTAVDAEVMVVAAYGIILPQVVLDMPHLGCLNIHASLLPRWRGAAPIQRAIQAGDTETGITIMQMDAGLDTGAMLSRHAVPITNADSTRSLHDKLAEYGAQAIVAALQNLPLLQSNATPQPVAGVTYAEKIRKEEAGIDWQMPAADIVLRLRAFDPFPGCTTLHGDTLIKCWAGTASSEQGVPGTVLAVDAQGILVAAGKGAVRLTELQRPGAKRLGARDFLAGGKLQVGEILR